MWKIRNALVASSGLLPNHSLLFDKHAACGKAFRSSVIPEYHRVLNILGIDKGLNVYRSSHL